MAWLEILPSAALYVVIVFQMVAVVYDLRSIYRHYRRR